MGIIFETGLAVLGLAVLRAVVWPLLGLAIVTVSCRLSDPDVSAEWRATGLWLMGVPRRQLEIGPFRWLRLPPTVVVSDGDTETGRQ